MWMNAEYIRETDDNKLLELVSPFWIDAGLTTKYWIETNWHWAVRLVGLLKERCRVMVDFVDRGRYFFKPVSEYDAKGVRKHFQHAGTAELLRALRDGYEDVGKWSPDNIDSKLRSVAEERNVKAARLIHATRLAVSGTTGGPGLFDILYMLGKKEVQARLDQAIEHIEACHFPKPEEE
jgi:glutamyl-tRNA synthetase